MAVRLPEPAKETVAALNEEIGEYAKMIGEHEKCIDKLSKDLKFRIAIRDAVQEHLNRSEEE